MHVLVTGGTGFIGTALCRRLAGRGDRITVLTRSASRARARLPRGSTAVETLEGLGGVDAVVNLAGEKLASGRWNEQRKQLLVDSRVQLTRRLVDWMRHVEPPRTLVSGSAIGWYGARGDELLAEASASGRADDFAAQLCRVWEAEAMRAESLGVRTCCLRTGIVLEKDGGSLKQMLLPFRFGLGGPMGSGDQWMSWIHRADLVEMLLWLLDTEVARGPYNGTAPQPVRHRDFARTLARVLHRPAVLRVPGPMLKLLLGEMADLVLSGQRVLPQHAQQQGFTFRYPDLDSALTAILRPTTPES